MSRLSERIAGIETEIEADVRTVRGLYDDEDTAAAPGKNREQITALNKQIEEREKAVADLKADLRLREGNERRYAELVLPRQNGSPTAAGGGDAAPRGGGVKSLGGFFVEAKEWREYVAQNAPNGHFGERQRVHSPPVQVKELSLKTLVTGASDTSAGALVIADQSGILDPLGRRALVLRDLVSVRGTTSDLVEYARMTSRVNAAAPVAEATATSGASGTKPEGGFALERVSAAVRTIAEWIPTTKRALADAGQIRGLIDDELRADLAQAVDTQILTGDGTGENFDGVAHVSGTQDQAFDTNVLTTTRKAKTLVMLNGRTTPTGFVLHPNDWQAIDLLQDNEARYYYGGPAAVGTPRLWGLPVVESEAATAGVGWVGNWKLAVLWDREAAQISVSDAHEDFFVRNLVAILAELRAAFGVIRPAAFVEIDLTA